MYNVVTTGSVIIILYLLSYFLSKNGFYPLKAHKKIWNILLAGFFISGALTGLFLALQINYKWNIPVIRSILRWHVESGIGLAFAGIIHFILHLSYFKKIFEKAGTDRTEIISGTGNAGKIRTNLFIVGFVSSSVQLLLIREMMNIAGGYELITGTFLGSWLISSAIGASYAVKSPLNDIRRINLIFSIGPLVSILLMIILSGFYLKPGVTPSFLWSIILTFIVVSPFCIVSGFSFVKLITMAGAGNINVPGISFSIETLGGVAAGIFISVLTSGILNTYQLLLMIILLNLFYVLIIYDTNRKKVIFPALVLLTSLLLMILIIKPDTFFRQQLLRGVKVTGTKDTPYGNITEGLYEGEKSIYYNQRLQVYKNDDAEREEDIHYAMLQSNSPGKVLMVSGDISSHLREIIKYHVKKVVYVERDPVLSDMIIQGVHSDKLKIESEDAFRYIRNTKDTFDVILILLPPPSTLLINKYYTSEFFAEVKNKLSTNGIFMCSPGTESEYMNKEILFLYSSIYNSLSSSFKNILPVAGGKLYFLASDSELSSSVCQLTYERKIRNNYVSHDYLSDDLITTRSKEVKSLIDLNARQNRSLSPIACFHYQSFNLSKSRDEKPIAIVLLFMAFALPLVAIRRKNILMYSAAAALSGFEIIALFMLQLTAGNMYQLTGSVIAGIMAGLAAGAGMNIKIGDRIPLRIRPVILIIFYAASGLLARTISDMNYVPVIILILIVTIFIPSFLTGELFRFLSKGRQPKEISNVYSADLTGSALGFIMVSGLAVPLLGITASIFLLSAIIFAGLVFGTIGNK